MKFRIRNEILNEIFEKFKKKIGEIMWFTSQWRNIYVLAVHQMFSRKIDEKNKIVINFFFLLDERIWDLPGKISRFRRTQYLRIHRAIFLSHLLTRWECNVTQSTDCYFHIRFRGSSRELKWRCGSSDTFTNFEFRIYEFLNEYLLWFLFQLSNWDKTPVLNQSEVKFVFFFN